MKFRSGLVALGVAVVFAVSSGGPTPASAAPSGDLVGLFRITSGSCTGGPHGSYFRMINPTGTEDGPFVNNSDSGCADKSYTLLSPGTDGGLATGIYQPAPTQAFDEAGNSLATRIIKPVRFFGVGFSGSTEPTDLQTGTANSVVRLASDGDGALSGDTRAFDATWNKQAFNQGAPKPDGSTPGITAPPKGTIDANNRYSLTWRSQIVGGPFNNFTGVWHLEGTFVPSGSTPAPGAAGTKATTTTRPSGATAGTASEVTTAVDTTLPRTESLPDNQAARRIVHKGWRAPTGLVLVIAAAGVLAVVALVVLDRRGNKEEA